MKHLIAIAFMLLSILVAQAQTEHNETHEAHLEEEESYRFELITSYIYSTKFEEPEDVHDLALFEKSASGFEVHGVYWLSHSLGLGMSLTTKFEKHSTPMDLALLASWNPNRWMTINAGPNFALGNQYRSFSLGVYAETEFNYRISESLHVGPLFGLVLSDESEYNFGFHLGFEF